MGKLFKSLLILSVVSAFGEPLPTNFVHAIHQVETGGRLGPIKGHSGELGPLQIKYSYWLDSGVPGSFSECADYSYSVKVMEAYLNLYGRAFILKNDFKSLARIHNGGRAGLRSKKTLKYSKKVIDAMKNLR